MRTAAGPRARPFQLRHCVEYPAEIPRIAVDDHGDDRSLIAGTGRPGPGRFRPFPFQLLRVTLSLIPFFERTVSLPMSFGLKPGTGSNL